MLKQQSYKFSWMVFSAIALVALVFTCVAVAVASDVDATEESTTATEQTATDQSATDQTATDDKSTQDSTKDKESDDATKGGDTVTDSTDKATSSDNTLDLVKDAVKEPVTATDPGKFLWEEGNIQGSSYCTINIYGLTDSYLTTITTTGAVTFDQADLDFFASYNSGKVKCINVMLTNYKWVVEGSNDYQEFVADRLSVVKSFKCTCKTSIPLQFYFNANNAAGDIDDTGGAYDSEDVTQPTNLPNLTSVDLSGIEYTGNLSDLSHIVWYDSDAPKGYSEGDRNCFILELGSLNNNKSNYSYGPTSLTSLSMPDQAIFGSIEIIGSAQGYQYYDGSSKMCTNWTVNDRVPLNSLDLSKCRMSNMKWSDFDDYCYPMMSNPDSKIFDQCSLNIRFTDLSSIDLGLDSTWAEWATMSNHTLFLRGDGHRGYLGYHINLGNNRLTGAYLDALEFDLCYRNAWSYRGLNSNNGQYLDYYLGYQEEWQEHQDINYTLSSTSSSLTFEIEQPYTTVNCTTYIQIYNSEGTEVNRLIYTEEGQQLVHRAFYTSAAKSGSSTATKITIPVDSLWNLRTEAALTNDAYTFAVHYDGISTISWNDKIGAMYDVMVPVGVNIETLKSPNLQLVDNEYNLGQTVYMGYGETLDIDVTMDSGCEYQYLTATSSDEDKVKVEAKGLDTREGHTAQKEYLYVISTTAKSTAADENILMSVFDDYISFKYEDTSESPKYDTETLAVDVNISDQTTYTGTDGFDYRISYDNKAVVIVGDSGVADTDITIPNYATVNGNSYYVDGIMQEAFKNNTTIESVTFADRSTSCIIGDNAFEGCTSLSAVNIPAYCLYIGTKAFDGAPVSVLTVSAPTSGSTSCYMWADSFNAPMYVYNATTKTYDAVNQPEYGILEAEAVTLTPGKFGLHQRNDEDVYDALYTVTVNVTVDGEPATEPVEVKISNNQIEETTSTTKAYADETSYFEPVLETYAIDGVAELGYQFSGLSTDITVPEVEGMDVTADKIDGLSTDSVYKVAYTTQVNPQPEPQPTPDNNSGTAATSSGGSAQTSDFTWIFILVGSLAVVATGTTLVVSRKRK